jgi:putative PIN family toxin of toxin-antitoxin system
MKIVLDTNVLLVSLSRKSELNEIFQRLIKGEYEICVTTEILDEYAEILERYGSVNFANNILDLLMDLPNLTQIDVYYKWNLISTDPDDNKFVDCALACNAEFIVTMDRHFNILGEVDFPKISVIDPKTFLEKF